MLRCILLLACVLLVASLPAQVRFSEAVNSNSEHEDEDGDTPDWFELQNTGDAAVNLSGWTVSDDADEPRKWAIPAMSIPAGGHQLFWASGKDRPMNYSLRALVQPGDACKYLIPTDSVDRDWIQWDFDDAGWQDGRTSLGYGDGTFETEVAPGTRSVFLRQTFELNSSSDIVGLMLDVDYDDGFVAYVNGREIGRANLEGRQPGYSEWATGKGERTLHEGGRPKRFLARNMLWLLRGGTNVLAIQLHNVSESSSDLAISAFLSARYKILTNEGAPRPDVINYGPDGPHTNFKLSAGGETLHLYDASGRRVDRLKVEGIPRDVSVGLPGAGGEPTLFERTTPGAPNTAEAYRGIISDEITFSREGGRSGAFDLTLSGGGGGSTIRFTTDATLPTVESPAYAGPIPITENTIVRARIFSGDKMPSPLQTEAYLIDRDHDVDVISIVAEPRLLFDEVDGIYATGYNARSEAPNFFANYWRDEEVRVEFNFFPVEDTPAFQQTVGLKIFGQYSRSFPQKSLSIHARKRYGEERLDYPFFDDRPFESYGSVILRSSGHDWMNSMMRDATVTGIMEGSGVDVQAYRPVATYINGQYWGLYNLREKINEDYLASHHGINPDSVDILEGWQAFVTEGSADGWLDLMQYVRSTDLSQDANFARIDSEIDLDNYIMYQVGQIYVANRDWPGNNIKWWRAQQPDAKWRWIMFDTDFALDIFQNLPASVNGLEFALATDGPHWPNPPESTELMRNLLRNEGFRHRFINRFADEMNSRFLFENVNGIITKNEKRIQNEILKAYQRWLWPPRQSVYVNRMRDYLRERPAHMKSHIVDYFDLPNYHETTIELEDPKRGFVRLNTLTIEEPGWSGDYFESVPITLEAVAREGYEFSHWELDSQSDSARITVDITKPSAFRPVFRSDGTVTQPDDDSDGLTLLTDLAISPNPASALARVSFSAKCVAHVSAVLYDARGLAIYTFADQWVQMGAHEFTADLDHLPAGVYQLRVVENESRSETLAWVLR